MSGLRSILVLFCWIDLAVYKIIFIIILCMRVFCLSREVSCSGRRLDYIYLPKFITVDRVRMTTEQNCCCVCVWIQDHTATAVVNKRTKRQQKALAE